MLQIKNISKQYQTGDLVQIALNDVSLNLRDNEFVSILGPSGSGKTTLLNIIGGLDRYDSGDLIINNVSTKDYKDRDWDSYRNHTIGFVFQSYNLIPHQTVLSNVELALTIGGISKKERTKRALDALEQVGLKEQAHKKPNQMSGGQMQRVAIARALVNNPDILLADEPTGALDTETSVQVMELLKEVAHDRLVIMVTHNPELAEEYSTRIVKLKDGKIIDDSDPFKPDVTEMEPAQYKNLGKASMSFFTAMSLSFNNLLTKKGRTILTAFAGSIGIIGIALILSLSAGFQNYIDKIQEDTLSSYPLTLTSETADMTSALLSMVAQSEEGEGGDVVNERQYISTMFSEIGKNDLKSFKKYLEKNEDEVNEMVSLVRYQYSVTPLIYTTDVNGEVAQLSPSTLLTALSGGSDMSSMMMSTSSSSVFNEMIDDPDTLKEQYDVLAGTWPSNYDEAIIVLPEPNGMPDLLVYSLGLRDNKELESMLAKVMAGEAVENSNEPLDFTYEELMNLPLKIVDASDTYKYNAEYGIYEDMSDDAAFMQEVYDNSIDLKIVGIVCAKEGSSASSLMPGVAYTKDLTKYVMETAAESEIVKKQMENEEINVFSNKRFDDDSEDAGLEFTDMISIDTEMLSSAFGVNISEEDIANMTQGYMMEISSSITADTSAAEALFSGTLAKLATDMLNEYIEENVDSLTNAATITMSDVDPLVDTFIKKDSSQALLAELEAQYIIPKETYEMMYSQLLKGMLQGYITMASMDFEDVVNMVNPDEITSSVEQYLASNAELTKEQKAAIRDLTAMFVDSLKGLQESETSEVDLSNVEAFMNQFIEQETVNAFLTELETNGIIASQEEFVANYKAILQDVISQLENEDTSEEEEAKAFLTEELVEPLVNQFFSQEMITQAVDTMATTMTQTVMQKEVLTKVGEMTGQLMGSIATAFSVDQDKIAGAFQFDMSEDELMRLFEALSANSVEQNANTNLLLLGYQDIDEPTTISFYFKDFESKELFIDFLEEYNEDMEKVDEVKVIKYTDLTGLLMSSVKTIVDSVSYVLIAFVSISLVVSSIMIGIITYISVFERTKEIGVLRAIGASKRNISSIFNAETFIVGLCSGMLGIGVTLALVPVINYVIHSVTGNTDINAVLPVTGATILVILSVILTLIGGFIPSKQAARKDPVLALRSE